LAKVGEVLLCRALGGLVRQPTRTRSHDKLVPLQIDLELRAMVFQGRSGVKASDFDVRFLQNKHLSGSACDFV